MDWLSSLGVVGSVLRVLILIFAVIMVFNLMILVHEWGHFLAARWRGLHVDRFQIWFGKPIWKKTYNGVQYGLGSIPAGGFVSLPQMAPMEAIEGQVESGKQLPSITPLDKIIVAFAGPLFSFLLACLFAWAVSVFGKPENESRVTNVVGYVLKDGPADKAGVRAGDRILEIDGQPIKHFEGFVDSVRWAIISSEGETIEMKVERPGEGLKMISIASADAQPAREKTSLLQWVFKRPALKEIGIAGKSTPMVGEVHEHSPAEQAGLLAGDEIIEINGRPVYSIMDVLDTVGASEGKTIQMKVRRESGEEVLSMTPRLPDQRPEDWDRPLTGFVFQELGRSQLAYPGVYEQVSAASRSMVNMIQKLFSPGSEISPAHMSGPVGIGRVYYSLLEQPHPLLMVLWFSVVLNVNLAIMNLLPFPVLDGGHIVMAIGEWVRGKPLQGRLLEAFQTVCALMLFGFLIFVTLKDAGDLVSNFGKKGKDKEEVELKWLPDAARAN